MVVHGAAAGRAVGGHPVSPRVVWILPHLPRQVRGVRERDAVVWQHQGQACMHVRMCACMHVCMPIRIYVAMGVVLWTHR